MSRIAVIGCGYVGLTTGACLARLGHDVVCADIDAPRVDALNRGQTPILEPGLDALIREGLDGGRLRFVHGAANAAEGAEFTYLCVPTPQAQDGSADLSFIDAAAREIGPVLPTEAVVINKSTVPVGSTRVVERSLGRDDVVVVSNPEFLREGSAVHDFLHPDRIVIGADDQSAAVRVAALYIGVTAPLIVTDPASAETIKYASNSFLATKVSFVNAVAAVCEAVGADIADVVLGMGYDSRIGHEFLKPGPGWGGSCLVGEETVLARRGGGRLRLLRLEELFAEVERFGAAGWEVLAWRRGEPSPELEPVSRFTSRAFCGEVVEVVTAAGQRVTTTACHPFVVGDGAPGGQVAIKLAGELTTADWLPLALGFPLLADPEPAAPEPPRLRSARGAWAGPSGGGQRLADEVWGAPAPAKEGIARRLLAGGGLRTRSRLVADAAGRLACAAGILTRNEVSVSSSGEEAHHVRLAGRGLGEAALARLDEKNAAWVRVAALARRPFVGEVYSLSVERARTVVTSDGLVVHNCFPKDTRALVRIAEDAGYDFGLLRGVVAVNDDQFQRVADKVVDLAGGSVQGAAIGAWGLTFKARTDDMRESPALEVLRRLLERGAQVRAYDPAVRRPVDGIEVVEDAYAAVEGARVLVVLTEWDEFRWLDFDKVAGLMAERKVMDARNLLDRAALARRGFDYRGIGRS